MSFKFYFMFCVLNLLLTSVFMCAFKLFCHFSFKGSDFILDLKVLSDSESLLSLVTL